MAPLFVLTRLRPVLDKLQRHLQNKGVRIPGKHNFASLHVFFSRGVFIVFKWKRTLTFTRISSTEVFREREDRIIGCLYMNTNVKIQQIQGYAIA